MVLNISYMMHLNNIARVKSIYYLAIYFSYLSEVFRWYCILDGAHSAPYCFVYEMVHPKGTCFVARGAPYRTLETK